MLYKHKIYIYTRRERIERNLNGENWGLVDLVKMLLNPIKPQAADMSVSCVVEGLGLNSLRPLPQETQKKWHQKNRRTSSSSSKNAHFIQCHNKTKEKIFDL